MFSDVMTYQIEDAKTSSAIPLVIDVKYVYFRHNKSSVYQVEDAKTRRKYMFSYKLLIVYTKIQYYIIKENKQRKIWSCKINFVYLQHLKNKHHDNKNKQFHISSWLTK